ncbi:hypothetical protein NQ317_017942 [Molorchus minor]|uniref:Uncharacterized protein n=1 Tax=Molorchus minor TaxID=1323400 RepID=A0ABQ9JG64_9CUCU|nr:hypothetical protein NQ317_017942 [Molorchus minor]
MLAIDGVNNPDIISINAASAALALSDVPWNGPIGAVRVGFIENEVIVNPTRKELQLSSLNLIVSATKLNLVVMLEGQANNILQQDLQKSIKIATKRKKLQKAYGKPKRVLEPLSELSHETVEALKSLTTMRVKEIFKNYTYDKLGRDYALQEVRTDVLEKIRTSFPDLDISVMSDEYNKIVKQIFRDLVFDEQKRCDGREFDELRNIECKVNLYKPLHGSAMFQRGQTQVFCTVTLDSHESAFKTGSVEYVDERCEGKKLLCTL